MVENLFHIVFDYLKSNDKFITRGSRYDAN